MTLEIRHDLTHVVIHCHSIDYSPMSEEHHENYEQMLQFAYSLAEQAS